MHRAAEIGQFDLAVVTKKQILWLQISMNYIF